MNFAAGGIATPADAALACSSGATACSWAAAYSSHPIPEARAQAIVDAVAHFNDPKEIAEGSEGLGKAMDSLDITLLKDEEKLSRRGI